jgi:hypothetical protein
MPRGESPVESNGVESQSTIGEDSVVLAVALRLERSQRVELSKGEVRPPSSATTFVR